MARGQIGGVATAGHRQGGLSRRSARGPGSSGRGSAAQKERDSERQFVDDIGVGDAAHVKSPVPAGLEPVLDVEPTGPRVRDIRGQPDAPHTRLSTSRRHVVEHPGRDPCAVVVRVDIELADTPRGAVDDLRCAVGIHHGALDEQYVPHDRAAVCPAHQHLVVRGLRVCPERLLTEVLGDEGLDHPRVEVRRARQRERTGGQIRQGAEVGFYGLVESRGHPTSLGAPFTRADGGSRPRVPRG